jgi:hypothetical protein
MLKSGNLNGTVKIDQLAMGLCWNAPREKKEKNCPEVMINNLADM